MAYPRGFDLSTIPFWNLYDQFRIYLLKIAGCNLSSGLGILNGLHLIVYLLSSGAVFGFLWRLSRHQVAAIVGTILFVSINFIDNSRMQISLSVPLFGVMALSQLIEFPEDLGIRRLLCFLTCIWLQLLVNVYLGLFTLVAVAALTVTTSALRRLVREYWLRLSLGLTSCVLLGVAPLVPVLLRLVTQQEELEVTRPTQVGKNLMEPWVLFSRPRPSWLGLPVAQSGQGPRLAWISVGIMLLLVIGLWTFTNENSPSSRRWTSLIKSAALLTLGYMNYPVLGILLTRLLEVATFIRSVSLLQFYFFLFLAAACSMAMAEVFRRSLTSWKGWLPLLLVALAVSAHLVESFVAQSGDTKVAIYSKTISPWSRLAGSLPEGAIAHYPDIHDEFSEYSLGLPNRIVEMAQLGHELPVLNGRDATEFLQGCGQLPDLWAANAVNDLIDEGAVAIVVHRQFISAPDLARSLNSLNLNEKLQYLGNMKSVESRTATTISTDPFTRALDADVFMVKTPRQEPLRSKCRFGSSSDSEKLRTSVSGPVYGQETNESETYWWHDGSAGVVTLTGQLLAPLHNRRVFLRLDRNPCGIPIDVKVRLMGRNGAPHYLIERVDTREFEAEIQIDKRRWWEPFDVRVEVPEVKCSVPGDPRNFGLRLLEFGLR